jgi:hypothetical protein
MVVPELGRPRVDVLEEERVIGTVRCPDGIVELAQLREVPVDVRDVLGVVRGGTSLGFGLRLDLGDEAVEDGGSLAVGERGELRVGGGIPRGVGGGVQDEPFAGGSEREERRGGENANGCQGLPGGNEGRFHMRGNEGIRYGKQCRRVFPEKQIGIAKYLEFRRKYPMALPSREARKESLLP